MKELERKDARLDFHEWNREVQRFNDDGFEDGRVVVRRAVHTAEAPVRDFGSVRLGSLANS